MTCISNIAEEQASKVTSSVQKNICKLCRYIEIGSSPGGFGRGLELSSTMRDEDVSSASMGATVVAQWHDFPPGVRFDDSPMA